MKIRIIKSCAVRGGRFSVGDRLAVGEDISGADAILLMQMGRAEEYTERKSQRAKTQKED